MHLVQGPGPRLLSVVSHGDDRAELPLLWRLSTALVELGHPVTVLDSMQSESATNPGLEQWLELRGRGAAESSNTADWTVIPCAHGLSHLCAQPYNGAARLQALGQLFEPRTIVVLYAGATLQVHLLGGATIRPLLATSGEKTSLLSAYLAIKRLWISGRLEPTILNMMPLATAMAHPAASLGPDNLAQCARNFLKFDVTSIHIDPFTEDSALQRAMRLLAARMVEASLPLCTRAREAAVLSPPRAESGWSGRH